MCRLAFFITWSAVSYTPSWASTVPRSIERRGHEHVPGAGAEHRVRRELLVEHGEADRDLGERVVLLADEQQAQAAQRVRVGLQHREAVPAGVRRGTPRPCRSRTRRRAESTTRMAVAARSSWATILGSPRWRACVEQAVHLVGVAGHGRTFTRLGDREELSGTADQPRVGTLVKRGTTDPPRSPSTRPSTFTPFEPLPAGREQLRRQGSNLDHQNQNLRCCLYTTADRGCRCVTPRLNIVACMPARWQWYPADKAASASKWV